MSSNTVIARELYKTYERAGAQTPVLCGVQLTIRAGEFAFLVGPSGSGKTTLLSILGCILTPDSGSVRILGEDLTQLDEAQRARFRRERIGFVFQRFHLIRGLNAAENVAVPLTLGGVAPGAARRRALELLDAVGLADRAKSHPARLSTGQCQRIALARALAAGPDLILADEPTASLDAENGREAIRLLRRLTAEQGKTAVVVTHDHRIFEFADRVLHLDAGRIRDAAAVDAWELRPTLLSAAGG